MPSVSFTVDIKRRRFDQLDMKSKAMGVKYSTAKCTQTTIDYIRTKDVQRLTRQLSKRRISFRPKKKTHSNRDENSNESLKLNAKNDEQQRSALHFAAIEGDATVIVALYEYMHTVDVNDILSRTPLHYAAIVGNEETLTALLLCNPNVNRMSKDGTTAVHEAIIHNHPQILTLLLQHGADIHIFYQEYLPSLILAVYLQHKNLVELLIRLGLDPNLIETKNGRSALHYAAYFHENADIFHILLSSTVHHIIDINAQDNYGFSVLDYARANIHRSTAIVDLLLQLNAYDPHRGEISIEDIPFEVPKIKVFPSSSELSSLKKNEKKKKSKSK